MVRNVRCTLRTNYPSFLETKNMRKIQNAELAFFLSRKIGNFVRNINCTLRTEYPNFVETKKHEENTHKVVQLIFEIPCIFFSSSE